MRARRAALGRTKTLSAKQHAMRAQPGNFATPLPRHHPRPLHVAHVHAVCTSQWQARHRVFSVQLASFVTQQLPHQLRQLHALRVVPVRTSQI